MTEILHKTNESLSKAANAGTAPCAKCGADVPLAKISKGPDYQFCRRSCSDSFMPHDPEDRKAVLAYRYSGLRASKFVLRGSPGHNPRADWLATGGAITTPDETGLQFLVIYETHRESGEHRNLLQGYRRK